VKRETTSVVAVVGPTGSGKSELGIGVAEALDGEVVGCDALQVYRELDIGTAKTPPSERRGIAHHLLDEVSPTEEFSAADYIARASTVVREIATRGHLPVLVGGTGLYLRALRLGLFEGPGRSTVVRDRLQSMAARRRPGFLSRLLSRWDPSSAARIHENDHVRLLRALEVRIQSGTPMSALMERRTSPLQGFQVILVGLSPDKSALSERIERRVDKMLERGFVREVRELRDRYGDNVPAFKAIGYGDVSRHLDGAMDEDELRQVVAKATTQYAKRQMTWFRGERDIEWFPGCGDEPHVLKDVLSYLRSVLPGRDLELMHAETAP